MKIFVKSKNQDLEVGISVFLCLNKKIFKKNHKQFVQRDSSFKLL